MKINSEQEMIQFGTQLTARYTPKITLSLQGDLGAGKTQLTKGIAKGLGIQNVVTSPTFSIIHEYEGTIPLLHIDLYRVSSHELQALDLEEIIENWPGWTVVEWGNLHPDILPSNHICLHIQIEKDHRIITCKAQGIEEFQKEIHEKWTEME